jgi:SpoVK/Ycf46/Vps4 family AAA+-type ATPase
VTPTPVIGYRDDLELLADELDLLDIRLRRRVAVLDQLAVHSWDPADLLGRAGVIDRREIDGLLSGELPPPGDGPSGFRALTAEINRRRDRITARTSAAAAAGTRLGLPRLVRAFSLCVFERDAMVICLAPELRRRYDRLYAYLQDDVTRQRATADLVLDLLCDGGSEEERWRSGRLLSPTGRLLRSGLLVSTADPYSPSGSDGLSRFLQPDPAVIDCLLGGRDLDPRLAGVAHLVPDLGPEGAAAADDRPAGLDDLATGLARLLRRHLAPPEPTELPELTQLHEAARPTVLHIVGAPSTGRTHLALRACALEQRAVLVVDAGALGDDPMPELLELWRQARLHEAILLLRDADALATSRGQRLRAVLAGQDAGAPGRLLITTGCSAGWGDGEAGLDVVRIDLGDHAPPVVRPAEAAARRLAADRALLRGTSAGPSALDVEAARRDVGRRYVSRLVTRIEPRYGWDDLVLPPDRIAALHQICAQARYRDVVWRQWGFAERFHHGLGLAVLFAGPAGTGKTTAAQVIAAELGLDLFTVDLSQVVSKYIGETEKQLGEVFREAERSGAVLFFDEADALFGRRSPVRDAHDRYANQEISYLLQRIETTTGIVLLATNLRANLDDAFARRLRVVVDFPLPQVAERELIWRRHLPERLPLTDDVDVAALARDHSIAGGSIRNVTLNAAFLAADRGSSVGQEQLLFALRQEYERLGRVWPATAARADPAGTGRSYERQAVRS